MGVGGFRAVRLRKWRIPDDHRVNTGLAAKRIVEHHDQADCEANHCHVDHINLQAKALRRVPAAEE